jgi:biopolymer transport protein ExbD
MKRFNFKTRFKYKAHIDITAMIDLVFLLVAFFMVTSSLGKVSSISINLPKANQTANRASGNVIISVNKKNDIYVNDVKIEEKSLLNEFKSKKKQYKISTVVIRGDKNANYETIIKVMDLLNQAGISKFTLSAIKSR